MIKTVHIKYIRCYPLYP